MNIDVGSLKRKLARNFLMVELFNYFENKYGQGIFTVGSLGAKIWSNLCYGFIVTPFTLFYICICTAEHLFWLVVNPKLVARLYANI